ncbi:XdhC family protein [Oceaniovalibus guishaninsula]|nr:XdhC/CoxI family protein [Oceaniovalibus guishaninsula]
MNASDHDDIPAIALAWHRAGQGAALATVVETWGSAPRPVGSQLAVSADGKIAGSVSGGCVEGAVIAQAFESIAEGGSTILEFGVADETAFAVGLACGGTIRILVEPVREGDFAPELLKQLVAFRADRQPVAYMIDPSDWSRRLIGPEAFPDRFRLDRSGFDDEGRFICIHNVPLRLNVIGAVHVAQPLLKMADLLGYDCTLIDPRSAFATAERFPDRRLLVDWPEDALKDIAIDARSAVVTLSHDPKIDDPALAAALRSDAFYIGALGSARTHTLRLKRLRSAGFDDADLSRINGPVGLPIGARSPAEIAVSIVAQMTARLRQG